MQRGNKKQYTLINIAEFSSDYLFQKSEDQNIQQLKNKTSQLWITTWCCVEVSSGGKPDTALSMIQSNTYEGS